MAQLGSGNGSSYPLVIDTKQTWVNGPNTAADSNTRMDAELVNDFAAAIVQLQTELGAKPSGTFASVRARLDQLSPVEIAGGKNEVTILSSAGGTALVAPSAILQGARVKAVVVKVIQTFSTEQGLTGFHVGGMGLIDGWGNNIGLALGTETTGKDFRRGDTPVARINENVVLTSVGGAFGASGELFVRILYETYTAS